MRRLGWGLALTALLATAGCPLGLNATSVTFVNNSTLSVEVQYFYGDNQLAGKEQLRLLGDEGNLTIPGGGTRTLSFDCDDLQAIFINEASLALPGGLGPERDTDILRDGSDFNCGDTITYTFSGVAIIDFAVSESVTDGTSVVTDSLIDSLTDSLTSDTSGQ